MSKYEAYIHVNSSSFLLIQPFIYKTFSKTFQVRKILFSCLAFCKPPGNFRNQIAIDDKQAKVISPFVKAEHSPYHP